MVTGTFGVISFVGIMPVGVKFKIKRFFIFQTTLAAISSFPGPHARWGFGDSGGNIPLGGGTSAQKKAGINVQILLEHRMTFIYREEPASGRILGIQADSRGKKINIRAAKAVIIATGGSTGNVNFRRMFDPRLTEEYCGLSGESWSTQDASGELAAMAIGASLWGLHNQTGEFGFVITKPGTIGCQYNYANLKWMPGSPVFDRTRASGLSV
jgi:hypothetical protein